MENMKEELYNELHIKTKEDKEIINELICDYSNYRMYEYSEMKALVKASYKLRKLNKAIGLFNAHKNTIFINGVLIFNRCDDLHKRELYYTGEEIDYWIDGGLIFSIKYELVRTIETRYETLYREDETLLW